MPLVHFRTDHVAIGHLDWTRDLPGPARTRATFSFSLDGVRIEVDPVEDRIAACLEATLSDDGLASLSEWLTTRRAPQALHSEVQPLVDRLGSAVERLALVLRFTYPMTEFRGAWLRLLEWSTDGETWERVMLPGKAVQGTSMVPRRIDEASEAVIQGQLDANVRPLVAFSHLERAREERAPRHRWIDATIAAELGIKEFLGRKAQTIAPLLLEVPSPPLKKLYAEILEAYDGTRSPYYKELTKGSEVRNHLIHRPDEPDPDEQAAADYVNVVTAALYDLMRRLYPDDRTIAEIADDEANLVEHIRRQAAKKR